MTDQKRTALITGSATGIGRAIALQLAERGCDVVVNYSRSREDAERTASEVEQRGARVLVHACDVRDDAAVRAMVERAVAQFGRLDILVNNAGFTHFLKHTDLEGHTDEVWDEIFQVNVKGAYYCCRAAIPAMQSAGGGAIVNIASVAGLSGQGSCIAYAASKGALITMTKSLARAFAPTIRVNAVCPGVVETRWLKDHQDMVTAGAAAAALKRASMPDDIAAAAVFLALDGLMLTGQAMVVDGGRTM